MLSKEAVAKDFFCDVSQGVQLKKWGKGKLESLNIGIVCCKSGGPPNSSHVCLALTIKLIVCFRFECRILLI